jgi:hypothetical protein
MNRRNFFKTLAGAVAGFTILPPALTYARTWKSTPHLWVPGNRGIWDMIKDCPPAPGPLDLDEMFRLIYAIKRKRDLDHIDEFILGPT